MMFKLHPNIVLSSNLSPTISRERLTWTEQSTSMYPASILFPNKMSFSMLGIINFSFDVALRYAVFSPSWMKTFLLSKWNATACPVMQFQIIDHLYWYYLAGMWQAFQVFCRVNLGFMRSNKISHNSICSFS